MKSNFKAYSLSMTHTGYGEGALNTLTENFGKCNALNDIKY